MASKCMIYTKKLCLVCPVSCFEATAIAMHVVLVHPNLKLFVRALNSMCRLGDELYLEFDPAGLSAKTVNSGRSAYAEFTFLPEFFHRHSLAEGAAQPEESLRCKIPMKAYRQTFRSLGHIERSVERCRIELDGPAGRLTVQFHCKQGISKLHQLYVLECECLQAVVSRPAGRFTRLSLQPKLLADLVTQNFQSAQEELTLTCGPRACVLCSYSDTGVPAAGSVETSLSLLPGEFNEYRPHGARGVTFCQRELRCLLTFGDWQSPASFPLEIEFERPGRPVLFHYRCPELAFQGRYVLSTLAEPGAATTVGESDAESELQTAPGSAAGSQLTVTTTSASRETRPPQRQLQAPSAKKRRMPSPSPSPSRSPSPSTSARRLRGVPASPEPGPDSQDSAGRRSAVLEDVLSGRHNVISLDSQEEVEEEEEGDATIGPGTPPPPRSAPNARGLVSMLQADSPDAPPSDGCGVGEGPDDDYWMPYSPVFGGPSPAARLAGRPADGPRGEQRRRPPPPLVTPSSGRRVLVQDSDGED